jgi:hypothetical protein
LIVIPVDYLLHSCSLLIPFLFPSYVYLSLNPSPRGEGLKIHLLFFTPSYRRDVGNYMIFIVLAPPPWGSGWGEAISMSYLSLSSSLLSEPA